MFRVLSDAGMTDALCCSFGSLFGVPLHDRSMPRREALTIPGPLVLHVRPARLHPVVIH